MRLPFRLSTRSEADQTVAKALDRIADRLDRLIATGEQTNQPAGLNVPVGLRRLIDRGLVYRPTRATYDFALPLFGPYLRRRPKLTKLSSGR